MQINNKHKIMLNETVSRRHPFGKKLKVKSEKRDKGQGTSKTVKREK
jgi:hypothetical protein